MGIALSACLVTTAPAQTSTDAAEGQRLYRAHCASCHGAEARGNGPVAPALRKQPPDLTLLAKANGGAFPTARVRRIVEGREVQAHGTREMPVWGDAFMAAREGGAANADAKIAAIIRHLESLQQKDAQ